MPPVGFEPTIAAGERPQPYALVRTATGTGILCRTKHIAADKMVMHYVLIQTSYIPISLIRADNTTDQKPPLLYGVYIATQTSLYFASPPQNRAVHITTDCTVPALIDSPDSKRLN
jgi:hypothetical protein